MKRSVWPFGPVGRMGILPLQTATYQRPGGIHIIPPLLTAKATAQADAEVGLSVRQRHTATATVWRRQMTFIRRSGTWSWMWVSRARMARIAPSISRNSSAVASMTKGIAGACAWTR